jgi:NhaP-type Na+/H+ and K+/H+ antiporter
LSGIIDDNDLKFVIVNVENNHPWVGEKIDDLVLPHDLTGGVIVSIYRDGKTLIPDDKTVIMGNDMVVVCEKR